MNGTGCAQGLVTDRILYYENPLESCDLQQAVWIGLVSTAMVLKCVTASIHTVLWFMMRKKLKTIPARSNTQKLHRFPLVLPIPWLSFAVYIGILITSVVFPNEPGSFSFLYGLGWVAFTLYNVGKIAKFMKLFHRMLPLSVGQANFHEKNSLIKLDTFGLFCIFTGMLALVGQAVVFCVLLIVYPETYTLVRIGVGFHTWVNLGIPVLAVYHINRVINT